jgi:hypothetical protein
MLSAVFCSVSERESEENEDKTANKNGCYYIELLEETGICGYLNMAHGCARQGC